MGQVDDFIRSELASLLYEGEAIVETGQMLHKGRRKIDANYVVGITNFRMLAIRLPSKMFGMTLENNGVTEFQIQQIQSISTGGIYGAGVGLMPFHVQMMDGRHEKFYLPKKLKNCDGQPRLHGYPSRLIHAFGGSGKFWTRGQPVAGPQAMNPQQAAGGGYPMTQAPPRAITSPAQKKKSALKLLGVGLCIAAVGVLFRLQGPAMFGAALGGFGLLLWFRALVNG